MTHITPPDDVQYVDYGIPDSELHPEMQKLQELRKHLLNSRVISVDNASGWGDYDEETTPLLTMVSDKGEMFFVSIHALGNSRKRADITILDSEGKTI